MCKTNFCVLVVLTFTTSSAPPVVSTFWIVIVTWTFLVFMFQSKGDVKTVCFSSWTTANAKITQEIGADGATGWHPCVYKISPGFFCPPFRLTDCMLCFYWSCRSGFNIFTEVVFMLNQWHLKSFIIFEKHLRLYIYWLICFKIHFSISMFHLSGYFVWTWRRKQILSAPCSLWRVSYINTSSTRTHKIKHTHTHTLLHQPRGRSWRHGSFYHLWAPPAERSTSCGKKKNPKAKPRRQRLAAARAFGSGSGSPLRGEKTTQTAAPLCFSVNKIRTIFTVKSRSFSWKIK